MRKIQTLTIVSLFISFFSISLSSQAQNTPFGKVDSLISPGKYNVWGYAFMDFYYKAHADTAGSWGGGAYKGRGGSNQYTGVPSQHSSFQSRRIYLGFDYALSKHFQTEFLLADEDNFNTATGSPAVPNGDLLA